MQNKFNKFVSLANDPAKTFFVNGATSPMSFNQQSEMSVKSSLKKPSGSVYMPPRTGVPTQMIQQMRGSIMPAASFYNNNPVGKSTRDDQVEIIERPEGTGYLDRIGGNDISAECSLDLSAICDEIVITQPATIQRNFMQLNEVSNTELRIKD